MAGRWAVETYDGDVGIVDDGELTIVGEGTVFEISGGDFFLSVVRTDDGLLHWSEGDFPLDYEGD